MMKKYIIPVLTIFIFFLSAPANMYASEDRELQFFGVGADVQGNNLGEYTVKTKGEKAEEGFVFTPQKPFTSTNILFSVELKGEGSVILKISETNAQGQFIKEETKQVQLTSDWAQHVLPFQLESTSSQVDVFVLTDNQKETEFSFRNVQVKESN